MEKDFSFFFGENLFDVLSPCLKNGKLVDVLKKHLDHNPEDLKKLLEKSRNSLKTNFDEELTKACNSFSKLYHLWLKRTISPLCSQIVLGHRDLSFYCFKSLMQLETDFKDDSLFSAVCSNGSMDYLTNFRKKMLNKMQPIYGDFLNLFTLYQCFIITT